jgi:hypothetical protein
MGRELLLYWEINGQGRAFIVDVIGTEHQGSVCVLHKYEEMKGQGYIDDAKGNERTAMSL